MIWHLLRYIVTFSIPAFYKRIQGRNVERLKVKGPVVIAMNHPNAFMDPVCFTWVSYPVRLRYMARGDAFKPGLATFLLDQLGIVPIFRLRDGGKEGLQKNDESYQQVNKLLKRNAKIIIFAEGLCIQERRLRPLKKGVSRMVFGAYDFLKSKDLIVVPVGVNYEAPSKFRSDLFYNVGEPIKVADFAASYHENPARAQKKFLELLDAKMRVLVTHIKNPANDKVVPQLEKMVMKDWLKRKNLKKGLGNEFEMTSHLTELINNLDELEPEKMANLRQKTLDYHAAVRENGLRDWIIDPLNDKKVSSINLIFRAFLILLGMPAYMLGLAASYLPYKLTEFATKKIVKKNKEFFASITVGLGTFIFLFMHLIEFFIIYAFSPNIICPLISLVLILAASHFSLYFHFFMVKTNGIRRALADKTLFEMFREKRLEIMTIVNGLTNF